mgnify:CR=1 FL=1
MNCATAKKKPAPNKSVGFPMKVAWSTPYEIIQQHLFRPHLPERVVDDDAIEHAGEQGSETQGTGNEEHARHVIVFELGCIHHYGNYRSTHQGANEGEVGIIPAHRFRAVLEIRGKQKMRE